MYNTVNCDQDNPKICSSVCRNYSSSSGFIVSPFYPTPYPDETVCDYIIVQPYGTYINLTILKFDIWSDDVLEIRDGSSMRSPLMGEFWGNNLPPLIQSTQNNMWIRYTQFEVLLNTMNKKINIKLIFQISI